LSSSLTGLIRRDPQGSPPGSNGRNTRGSTFLAAVLQRIRGSGAAALALIGAAYFVAGKLGLKFAFIHPSATAVWPPTGFALAAMLIFGRRVWPSILLGAFFVNITTFGSIATSTGIAVGNTLEALAGAYLVERFARGTQAFVRPQDVFKFGLLAGVFSTAVSATFGVTSLCLGGAATWDRFGPIWLTWWLGDSIGNLVVAPAIVLWALGPRLRLNRSNIVHSMLLASYLFTVSMIVFDGWGPWKTKDHPLEFLCMPVLVWAAFRLGPVGAATSSTLLAAVALWGTVRGFGPFVAASQNESLLLLQAYMGISAIMSLAVAAVVWDWQQSRQKLTDQGRELERSNVDLRQFAYMASHDLREPLRTVSCFADLFARKYHGYLDEDADDYIRSITSGVRRMEALIDGVLAYSRVDTDSECTIADTGEALRSALANLTPTMAESHTVVTHDPLPLIRANEMQLVIVFQNLIANAIKYRDQEPPRIHVAAQQEHDAWVFSVRDNGIGIQPEYIKEVFVLFKRLHGPDRAGTGIGLATSKKIVERHGGRIWVESRPGSGSTFFFTIPTN
jgi:signal transduction histidine kinase